MLVHLFDRDGSRKPLRTVLDGSPNDGHTAASGDLDQLVLAANLVPGFHTWKELREVNTGSEQGRQERDGPAGLPLSPKRWRILDEMADGALLPSQQQDYDGLPRLSEQRLHARRETVFLLLSGAFLGTLAMLNLIGITRFVDLSFAVPGLGKVPMPVAVGVLPYPVTFLCTDFISELYGSKRASLVVWMGLGLNAWIVAILWLGGVLPGAESPIFDGIRRLAFGAVAASMIAYLSAQLVDVHLFHFWMRLTRGKHLWLRNNGSTLVSQLVDTVAVILITHYATRALPVDANKAIFPQLLTYIGAGYTFKLVAALLDTLPFYVGSSWLRRYLRLPSAGANSGGNRWISGRISGLETHW